MLKKQGGSLEYPWRLINLIMVTRLFVLSSHLLESLRMRLSYLPVEEAKPSPARYTLSMCSNVYFAFGCCCCYRYNVDPSQPFIDRGMERRNWKQWKARQDYLEHNNNFCEHYYTAYTALLLCIRYVVPHTSAYRHNLVLSSWWILLPISSQD